MKKRACCIIICVILAIMLLTSASADVFSDEERYQAALIQLNAYLNQNTETDLNVVMDEFSDLRGYKESGEFKIYATVMRELNSPEPNEIFIQRYLDAINSSERFKELLKTEDFTEKYQT